jgi:murein L,D-transpeptidase YcbB/YkuD
MVVLRRESAWLEGRRRLHVGLRRLARFGTPVLVLAAALFGAAVSAAILVGFWGTEAGRRHAVENKLAASVDRTKALTAENGRLRTRLAAGRKVNAQLEQDSARLRQGAARLRVAAQDLLHQNAALVASATRLHDQSGSLERRAASVSKLAATLGNDLVAVLGYITNTSASSLDPSYLKAQLDYLKPAVESVEAAAGTLGADAGGYGAAVDRFAAQADAYAAALSRLAGQDAAR